MGTDAHSVAGQSPARHEDTNDITDAPTRRAVVLVGHGGALEVDPGGRPRRDPDTGDHQRLRAEFPHLSVRYAWPFAGEHLAEFFVEHLRQFDRR